MSNNISYLPLEGGEDLVTPSVTVNPGRLRFSRNYECDHQGKYRRIDGYERFDGRPKPSDASYWILRFTDGGTEISEEDIVTGDTSSATGEALVVEVESGDWGVGDASGFIVLFNVSGTFEDDEDLTVSAATVAVADGTALERGADNDTDDTTYLRAAIEATRVDIEAVPGSGSILGVWQYGGKKYTFRNNTLGTAAVMYEATITGWDICDLGEKLTFGTGTVAFVEGETVSQAGVTAVVRRVVVTDGTWAGGDATGYFTITGRAGGDFTNAAITGSGSGAATALAEQTDNEFLPSGRFEFINHNFYGHTESRRMYGCDGVNQGFEYDGNYFVFITTGMANDKPEHIYAHRNHLFFSFDGGSLQPSSIGSPLEWSALTGAAEFGIGDEITGMLSLPEVLAVWTRNSTQLLYGTSVDDWVLQPHSDESGAIEWTLQKMGQGIYLDDRGLTTLGAVDVFGDFASNVISLYVQPFLKTKMKLTQSSVRVREKNQYRLFFTDKECLTLTMDGNKVVGFTRQFYEHLPVCCCSSEDSDGFEELFFGSDDGFVYQLDKGTSFDGTAIQAIIRTHFNNLKTPSNKKRFRKLTLEMVAPLGVTVSVFPDFSYASEDTQSTTQDFNVQAQGGAWDINDWDDFIWDGPFVGTAEARIDGSGTNIALLLTSSSAYDPPHTLQGIIVHYDVRGLKR